MNDSSARALTTSAMRPEPSSPDMRRLAGFPHRDFLELETATTAPKAARHWIARRLSDWSLPHLEVAASLVTSELVTNGVVATLGMQWASAMPPVLLWLLGGPSAAALLAWDATMTAPVPRDAREDDESGRGLAIVGSLSAECGFYYPAQSGGKVTWAVIVSPL